MINRPMMKRPGIDSLETVAVECHLHIADGQCCGINNFIIIIIIVFNLSKHGP